MDGRRRVRRRRHQCPTAGSNARPTDACSKTSATALATRSSSGTCTAAGVVNVVTLHRRSRHATQGGVLGPSAKARTRSPPSRRKRRQSSRPPRERWPGRAFPQSGLPLTVRMPGSANHLPTLDRAGSPEPNRMTGGGPVYCTAASPGPRLRPGRARPATAPSR